MVRRALPSACRCDDWRNDWLISPHAISGWTYTPVLHVSEVGYHPAQKKIAVIEVDGSDSTIGTAVLRRISEDGGSKEIVSSKPTVWGKFLRYSYLQFDFSQVKEPGIYVVAYDDSKSVPFQIAKLFTSAVCGRP
jgi:endoglucanase